MTVLDDNTHIMHLDTILTVPDRKADEASIIADYCSTCDQYWFPHFHYCPDCLTDALIKKKLSKEGTLYSYTTVHTGYPGFPTPYSIGYVDFPEGVRVIGQIECEHPETLQPDMRVTVTVGMIKYDQNDQPVYSWKFRPVRERKG